MATRLSLRRPTLRHGTAPPLHSRIGMSHLLRSKTVVASVAIACVSILSGCWHHRRDPVYVEHVQVHVDEHPHQEHREDRRER
jgi:hypothetical protein